MGRVFSQLGLKSKLTHGFHLRGRRKRCLRPVTRVKADGGSEWVPGSDPGQGGSSSEKEEEATGSVDIRGEGVSGAAAEKKPMVPEATVSEDRLGSLTPARGGLQVLGPEAMADGSGTGSVSLGLELTLGLVLDPVLEPVLVLEQDSVLGLDPDPDPGLVPDLDLVLDQDPIMDPDPALDPVPRGGLSVEQGKEFERVFSEMFPDSASCSQGADPNTCAINRRSSSTKRCQPQPPRPSGSLMTPFRLPSTKTAASRKYPALLLPIRTFTTLTSSRKDLEKSSFL
jgi:hypothetical protein